MTNSTILRLLLVCAMVDGCQSCIDTTLKIARVTSYRRLFSEQELRAIVREECRR